MKNSVLTPSLADSMVRVTESAAIAAAKLVGRGDEKKADAAAVDAMRTAFNGFTSDETVVATDEPMVSLYLAAAPRVASNVVTL